MGKKINEEKPQKLFSDEAVPEMAPPGKTLICRPYITLKNGTVLHASQCGKKAFCFYVNN